MTAGAIAAKHPVKDMIEPFQNKIKDTFTITGIVLVILFLIVYPLFTMFFLIKHQDKMKENTFKRKFSTLYDGMYTESKQVLLYNTVFCMRRFFLVFINVSLNVECPWTDLKQN